MKKILLLFTILLSGFGAFAQMAEHAFFKTTVKELGNNEAEIRVKATMDKGWHLYASPAADDDPSLISTEVTIKKTANITPIGKMKAIGKIIDEDIKAVGIVHYYKDKVDYVQKVKYKKKGKVEVEVYYQTCDDKGCLPPTTLNFTPEVGVAAKNKKSEAQLAKEEKAKKDSLEAIFTAQKKEDSINTAKKLALSKEKAKDDSAANAELFTEDSKDADTVSKTAVAPTGEKTSEVYGEYGTIVGDCGEEKDAGLSMWTAFLYGILGGLAALFFPCTLPMIPMTISFFLKSAGDKKQGIKNGIWYGFSIFLVYFLLSLPFLFLGWGGSALHSFSTNVWVNLAFFAVFIVFAFSLFGFYDISLPSSMTQKIDSKSNATSFGGIFFMALTLAIVSFSCTGPILGLVLGNISNAKLITPAMSGFGIGLGVPFALFAMFPNLLKALPKSGGWLTVLKAVFGFIELAFALKFLSNADLVMGWGLLKRETFLALWIILCVVTGLYLLGKFTIKKGSVVVSTRNMKIFAVLFFLLAGYISLDFFKVNVNLLGFPPPKFYAYGYSEEGHEEKGVHFVNGIKTYTDLDMAMEEAKKQNKPLMIDFTGWACVNCRKMEENVWPTTKVREHLSDNYVIASLYVDEQIELPEEEHFLSPYLKREAKTVGDKWFDLSLRNFRAASQPFYVLIDPKGHRILNTPKAYTPNPSDYAKFLDCGLKNYKSLY